MAELSYFSGVSDAPLIGETIDANLRRAVANFGDREAVVDCAAGARMTYREVDAAVEQVARGLFARGVAKGDRVGIWAPNCLAWYLVQYATARIGAILVNINPSYRTHELEYALRQSEIGTLVSAIEFKTSDYRGMIEQVRGGLPALRDVIYIDDPSWDALLADGAPVTDAQMSQRAAGLSFDDPINIQYTSGTTGYPKGATLSHHNILNNGYFVGELMHFTEADRLCVAVPFYHCFGMVMGNLGMTSHGGCVVLPSPGFDPAATLRAVQDEKCTGLFGVPTMFIAELGLANFACYDLTSLRTGCMAGSPCPVEVMKRVINEMHMEEVCIAYGMTETSPVSTQTRTDDSLDRRVSTVGQVHPHVEIKVVDPDTGLIVPIGTPGEFCTRGYSVMIGYWNEPDKTAEVLHNGWMRTGDLGVMDADGYVNIVGRIKDMIIRGGENVYPREIEEFLYTHPDIVDAQVIGIPDERFGEELMAWVRLREGAEPLTAEALRGFCEGKLAHYKIPRQVRIVTEFPMTVTGKIRKAQMREESIEILGLAGVADAQHA
ncbi:MAG: AMP-binding protein [Sciscionella sp.]